MLHATSFLPGVSVQDLPREQHSRLSPKSTQSSTVRRKEAPAAKGHRALLSRKQTLYILCFCRINLAGGTEPTLQQCKCGDKFPQINVCHIIHRHLVCPKSVCICPLPKDRSKDTCFKIWSLTSVVWRSH